MSWSFFLRHQALGDEKAVCRYAQRHVVMKAAPAASLEMPQAKFLLEFLVITLNTPAQFCESHELLDWCISRQRTEEVPGRLDFFPGPLDEQPLFLGGLRWLGCAGGAVYPYCCKARRQGSVGAFTPCDRAKAPRRQLHGQLFRLQWRLSLHLQADRACYPDHIREAHRCELLAELGACPVPGVGDNQFGQRFHLCEIFEQLQREHRLGDELKRLGHFGSLTTVCVIGPALRQIQLIAHRQTEAFICERDADRDLAVVLFPELATILPSDPDRVLTLLRNAGIINNQRLRRTRAPANSLKYVTAHRIKHRLIRPRCIGYKVMQTLVFQAHPVRRQMRSHGLNALALDRQHQPRAVATKWLDTISVPKRLSHQGHILLESFRRGFHRCPHNVLEDKRIMPYFLTQWY